MITRREALRLMSATGVAATLLSGCAQGGGQETPKAGEAETKRLRVLATSDLHGMFVPWDYALDAEDPSGSMAKLATAIKELRDEQTLLVDAGDTIQDNMADLFITDEVHPMIACMNELGYEVGVTGNHEYNFGMDVLRKTVASFAGTVLTGNVIDENGDPVADGYTILDKDGVRVGLIGMVTPLIARWDRENLEGCVVSDPLEETRKIIDQIKGDVDVLIGVMHMGVDNEYDLPNTGARDIAEACPEFDLIVSAHAHKLVEGEEINGVLVVENQYHAQTLSVVDLTLERVGEGWKVVERASNPVEVGSYEPDPDIIELMAPYDERAKKYAREEIGVLEGGPLAPENEFEAIPAAVIADTAFIDLIHEVQLYHTGADISTTAYFLADANVEPGPIRRCDASLIFKHVNTLYALEMTGAQLKKYLELSATFYQTFHEGDLTLSFNPEMPMYNYDMFQGVNYQVNVAKEPGKRIEGLSRPDGTSVQDDDVLVVAVNSYRANSHLLVPGVVFEEGDMPKLLEADVHGYIGGIREMVADYIENVKGGTITPACDDNWKLVGNDWDEKLHQRVVELVADGELTLNSDDKHLPDTPITEDDLKGAIEEKAA